jgi:hypothetical protein
MGGIIPIAKEIVHEEAASQTGEQPVDCRQSRHGADPSTGLITWIVSFLKPVRPFTLFGDRSLARLIKKSQRLTRHDPGCQDYCNPVRCNRQALCRHCSVRTDRHEGAWGDNCNAPPRCANCHGPFPATHTNCPAAPVRKGGKLVRLENSALQGIRKHCEGTTQRQDNTPETERAGDTPFASARSSQDPATTQPQVILKRRRGDAVLTHEQAVYTPSAPASSRPARLSSQGVQYNLKAASRASAGLSTSDSETSSTITVEIDMEDSTSNE